MKNKNELNKGSGERPQKERVFRGTCACVWRRKLGILKHEKLNLGTGNSK